MANARSDWDKIFQKVVDCRKSGLSDRQWCLNEGIAPSTFYTWVRKLRERACCEIPESEAKATPAHAPHQDVVKINVIPENNAPETKHPLPSSLPPTEDAPPIEIHFQGIRISIRNSADPLLLANTLKMMKGLVC